MPKTEFQYYKVPMVDTIAEMIDYAAANASGRPAYKFKKNGEVQTYTFGQFIDRFTSLGAYLVSKGFTDCHYACVGKNSFNWITAYFTGLRSSGVFVPVDKELPEEDLIHILNDCEAQVLFCDKKYEPIIEKNIDSLKGIKFYISLDREEDEGRYISIETAVREGSFLDKSAYLEQKTDNLAMKMLVYTSGTTGMSKGVMLSEHNLIACTCNGLRVTIFYDVGLSVLPYNHTYENIADLLISFHHHSCLCINDSLKAILNNMKLYQPDYICIVPAIAEIFYNRTMRELEKTGMTKKFNALVATCNGMRKAGVDKRRKLFEDILDKFGGNLKKVICGGAPVRAEVAEFFENIGIDFINGYGITECSPLICVNNDEFNDYRTVGYRLPCIEWRIDKPNSEGIGEICVKGDIVMMGYYHNREQTDEVLKDGWFYTGDYGLINEDNRLVICGRKKNIIVLNNGKNIYPEEIESYIQGIDYVQEVIVSGTVDEKGNETTLQAEVYLNEKKTGAEVLRKIREVCRNLPIYKQVSDVKIRDEEFEKTSTNKIKRKQSQPDSPKVKEKPKKEKKEKVKEEKIKEDKPKEKKTKEDKPKEKKIKEDKSKEKKAREDKSKEKKAKETGNE